MPSFPQNIDSALFCHIIWYAPMNFIYWCFYMEMTLGCFTEEATVLAYALLICSVRLSVFGLSCCLGQKSLLDVLCGAVRELSLWLLKCEKNTKYVWVRKCVCVCACARSPAFVCLCLLLGLFVCSVCQGHVGGGEGQVVLPCLQTKIALSTSTLLWTLLGKELPSSRYQ
jgi:hypothetical protein